MLSTMQSVFFFYSGTLFDFTRFFAKPEQRFRQKRNNRSRTRGHQNELNPSRSFIRFTIAAAEKSQSICEALIDAGIMRLLVCAISDTTPHALVLWDDFRIGEPTSLALLRTIRRNMIYGENLRMEADDSTLSPWKTILNKAVDMFMVDEDFADRNEYMECRGLLHEILSDGTAQAI